MQHIRYDLKEADGKTPGVLLTSHPQTVVNHLGIQYEACKSDAVHGFYLFENCTHLPEPLPSYLKVITIKEPAKRQSPDQPTSAQVDQFLIDLTALTLKHQIVINGCGCCGSPFIYTRKDQGKYSVDMNLDNLMWINTVEH